MITLQPMKQKKKAKATFENKITGGGGDVRVQEIKEM